MRMIRSRRVRSSDMEQEDEVVKDPKDEDDKEQ